MTKTRLAISSVAMLANAQLAQADTGTTFNCNVEREPETIIYLDSTNTRANVEWGGKLSPAVRAKNGALHVNFAGRSFAFVPNWLSGKGIITITGPNEVHAGICTM